MIVKYTEESTPLHNRRGITSMAYEAIVPSSLHSFRFREMSKAPYSKQCDACIPERHHRVRLPSVPKTMQTKKKTQDIRYFRRLFRFPTPDIAKARPSLTRPSRIKRRSRPVQTRSISVRLPFH